MIEKINKNYTKLVTLHFKPRWTLVITNVVFLLGGAWRRDERDRDGPRDERPWRRPGDRDGPPRRGKRHFLCGNCFLLGGCVAPLSRVLSLDSIRLFVFFPRHGPWKNG